MTMVSRHRELASFAHNPDTQVDFSIRAERFLEKIKETPTHRPGAKPMRKTVRAAVKDLDRLQHEHREMYAVHLMPYYQALTDALASLACEVLAFIEQLDANAESKS